MEKIISLKGLGNPDAVIAAIEKAAQAAHADGWFFVSNTTDEWLESVTLHFERDLEV